MSKADELEAQANELFKQARKARAEEKLGFLSVRLKRIEELCVKLYLDPYVMEDIADSLENIEQQLNAAEQP
jgi:hypothetical protein